MMISNRELDLVCDVADAPSFSSLRSISEAISLALQELCGVDDDGNLVVEPRDMFVSAGVYSLLMSVRCHVRNMLDPDEIAEWCMLLASNRDLAYLLRELRRRVLAGRRLPI